MFFSYIKTLPFLLVLIFSARKDFAQNGFSVNKTDSVNNFVLPLNYRTSEPNAIPHFIKAGKGKQTIILIPGLGFDESVFTDFIKANKKHYTIYCITIPGYGNTQAPAVPAQGTSFGEQSWNKSVLTGIARLIDNEKINKPIIVGHYVQGTQLALRMAIDYPDKVGGVIILGGVPKFISVNQGKPIEYPLQSTIAYTDTIIASKWFGAIDKTSFDKGNYLPEVYSLNPAVAKALWQQVSSVPLPVMVRYLCEFFASDVTLEMNKIKSPVLALLPSFNNSVLENPVNNYILPQFITKWETLARENTFIKYKKIQNAASFIWKDNPEQCYQIISHFIHSLK